jgi:RNA recognition motif-containing protein
MVHAAKNNRPRFSRPPAESGREKRELMSRKLFVGNLSYNTTEDSLEGLFTQVGPVDSVRVMRDMTTGRSRGFGFVEMQSEDDARNAIDKLNDTDLDGRRIAVNVAQPKPAGAGAGGPGGGRGGFGGQRRREPRW